MIGVGETQAWLWDALGRLTPRKYSSLLIHSELGSLLGVGPPPGAHGPSCPVMMEGRWTSNPSPATASFTTLGK